MGFAIGSLFEASLLFINAIAILNEDRFLVKGTLMLCNVLKIMHTKTISNLHSLYLSKIVILTLDHCICKMLAISVE